MLNRLAYSTGTTNWRAGTEALSAKFVPARPLAILTKRSVNLIVPPIRSVNVESVGIGQAASEIPITRCACACLVTFVERIVPIPAPPSTTRSPGIASNADGAVICS
jgi:hypothetical protein